MKFSDCPEEMSHHGRRGGFSKAARYAHVVDGRQVTTREIAERFGIGRTAALDRAKRGPFPLTWEGLKR